MTQPSHDPDAHVDAPTQLDRATMRAQPELALGPEITLERLIREAFAASRHRTRAS